MAISNDYALIYLKSSIGKVHKIIPLYQFSRIGLPTYVDSLIFELEGFERRIPKKNISEYESLINILTSIKEEVKKEDSLSVIRRESFKCIGIIKKIISKLEDGIYE